MIEKATRINDKRITDWNHYAQSFHSVMPSEMLQVNRAVASYMYGSVADFGCGSGKIIPFIAQSSDVKHYTGIDCSPEMIARARWIAEQFSPLKTTLVEANIESTNLKQVDSAFSINSYYIWPEPLYTLEHIFQQIKPGGTFVLATINDAIDMPALLDSAAAEMIAHPYWHEFKEHNLTICNSKRINLVDLDTLIGQVRDIGFVLEEAHRRWYERGLNLLVMKRA